MCRPLGNCEETGGGEGGGVGTRVDQKMGQSLPRAHRRLASTRTSTAEVAKVGWLDSARAMGMSVGSSGAQSGRPSVENYAHICESGPVGDVMG